MRCRRLVLLTASLLMAGAELASAHQVNLSTARVELGADRVVSVELTLKGSDVDRLAGTRIFDAAQDAVDPASVAAATAAIISSIVQHVAVTEQDGTPCVSGTAAVEPDGDGIVFRNSFDCRKTGGDIVYRSTVLTSLDPAARQVVLIRRGPTESQALLDDANNSVVLSAPPPSLSATMRNYVVTGIEHIFAGYDHVAFLIAVVLWARRLVPVIKIVTAFTVAHSITLSLAALDIVVLPSLVVEPAIAASIVVVALENFFSRDVDGRWRVAFVFGLVHGFGFAGALREVGLPSNALVTALAAFNIGVEIGQVAIVSLVVPALIGFDQLIAGGRSGTARPARLVYALSALITVLGGYWFVVRILAA